ncbi:helix-turn-helix transcriptional regulator [Leisingera sp. HS039]|uniref:helix-turn-helix domain-containing protein n=1 Tax=Leisingera sp. HS039 TaxID=2818496 RepID=UPI001FFDDAF2|nr:helix-turn-helix transcriptional regulator [Leisingera sp. HS039]
MDFKGKLAMSRLGDASREACAFRLKAARIATGLTKTEFCKNAGVSLTSYLNSEAGLSFPSRKVMLYLHRGHRIDFNYIIHGDFQQLPSDVQDRLFSALKDEESQ